jgi:hypothetical protein
VSEAPLRVGDVLYGFWNGPPSRDVHHADKRVEAIGSDWVVLRFVGGIEDNGVELFSGEPDELCHYKTNRLVV